ncbi:MAG: DUF4912 domain-containing protein [Cyanobacteria bacterium P01_D01_bin.105]
MRANRSALVKLCLLTALAVPVQRAASATTQTLSLSAFQADNTLLLAQENAPADLEFEAPASLEGADTLLIDGSSSMRSMNEALTQQFQAKYASAVVESATSGTDIALNRLLNGEIDLAAIGRPLTEAEIAAGLVAVPIAREKIAIFVGADNPFTGDITFEEFGSIFRGETTEWADVDDGSGTGTLRFVDRPETSDTRQAFRPYPVFQAAPFETGVTAEPVAVDETEAVIEALGKDGIGYAIANQVMGNPNVKIVPMHQTLPDNPAYPFSQPRNYVYLNEPSPEVAGFLAVATSPEGEDVIEAVRATEGAAAAQLEGPAASATSADGSLVARSDENNVAVIEDADGNLVVGPLAGAGGAVTALAFSPDGETLATGTNTGKVRYWGIDGEPQGEPFDAVIGADNAVTGLEFQQADELLVSGSNGRVGLWGLNGLPVGETAEVAAEPTDAAATASSSDGSDFPWWLLLLPLLGLLGGLGLWLLTKGKKGAVAEPKRQTSPTATVPPPLTDPDSDREVSSRAQTVISTDRVVDDSRDAAAGAVNMPLVDGPSLATANAENIGAAGLNLESTDLESPDLEGTNLDLSPSALGLGAAASVALGGAGLAAGLDSGVETDDDDEEWDDNLDLTLEDEPEPTADDAISSAMPSVGSTDTTDLADTTESADATASADTAKTPEADDDDFWNTAPAVGAAVAGAAGIAAAIGSSDSDSSATPDEALEEDTEAAELPLGAGGSSSLDSIEPTRDMVIAETGVVTDLEPDQNTIIGESAVIVGGGAALGSAAVAAASGGATTVMQSPADLADVDDGLNDLPEGYGESCIVLLPRDPKWAYAYWDVPYEHKQLVRDQGGQRLMLRLYDVTDINQDDQASHGMQQFDCNEMARSWYLEIPVSDRDYTAEIGYLTGDDHWLVLARSVPVRIPPIYPSDWVKDQFVTIDFDESLTGRTFGNLGRPGDKAVDAPIGDLPPIYSELFALTQGQNAMRVAGSLFGSMHQVPPGALTSSGMGVAFLGDTTGVGAAPNLSGLNMSGLNVSGLNMSGVGMGDRKRNFWLVADAELIVYGATEPDATLTIGDQVVPLNPDGTFRFHVAFPDGNIDYPIKAVAADGEQSRSITMNFERGTPERNTNTKEEAQDEWF